MTEDMRKDFIAAYKKHMERMSKFFDMNAPEAILASEVKLALKLSLGYMDSFAEDLTNDVVLSMRHYIGRCRYCCDKLVGQEMCEGVCTKCWEKERAIEYLAEVEYGGES